MVTIIISTFNERIFNLVLPQENDKINYIIVHQKTCFNFDLPYDLATRSDVQYFSLSTIGLSVSRNYGLYNCKTEFAHIMDDDVEIIIENILEMVHFMESEYVDICTGMFQFQNNKLAKNYLLNPFSHNTLSLGKVSSIEICVRLSSIQKLNLYFDNDFGLGSKYPSGEEYIFLTEGLRKGLKIKFYPVIVGIHPNYTSGIDFFSSNEKILAKSKMIEKVFGIYSIFFKILFWLKKSGYTIKKGYFFNFTKVFFFNRILCLKKFYIIYLNKQS